MSQNPHFPTTQGSTIFIDAPCHTKDLRRLHFPGGKWQIGSLHIPLLPETPCSFAG